MSEKNYIGEDVGVLVRRRPLRLEAVPIIGTCDVKLTRNGRVIVAQRCHNLVTTQGVNYLLETGFNGGTAIGASSWYAGVATVTSSATNSSVGADLAGTTAVTEFVDYDNDTGRNLVTWATASSRAITGTVATMTMDSAVSATLVGAFICGGGTANTQGSSATYLFNVINFASSIAVTANDQLDITYTLTIGSSDINGASI